MKKLATMAISIVLIACMVAGGSLAYLSDTASDVNVMTLGNVKIDVVELERKVQNNTDATSDNLQEFTNKIKPLYPVVGERTFEGGVQQQWATGGESALYNAEKLKNVVDKFVFTKNTGKSEAYVRTLFAFEAGDLSIQDFHKYMHLNINDNHYTWTPDNDYIAITVDGINYYVAEAIYDGNAGTDNETHKNGVLPAGETTRPSLLQYDLDSSATNEICEKFGDTYEIKVLSQAAQTAGFADAKTALDTAFGKVSVENSAQVAEWFKGVVNEEPADTWDGTADTTWYNDTDTEFVITTAEQLAGLAQLVDSGNNFAGKTIKLGQDLDLAELPFNPIGHSSNGKSFNGTFDGQGHTISNMYEQSDLSAWQYEGEYYGLFAYTNGATIKDVTIADAYISSGRNEAAGVVGNAVDTTFSDITISNTTLIAYNNSAGGVAAECYGDCSFTNITVDEDTVIGPLWGTYDVRLGGVVGMVQSSNNVTFKNITVACQLDAINDVAANYQYWLYRYSGMLIGHVDGVNGVADPTGYVTCENVKVIYGDWVNYHYCEDADLGAGSYNGPGEYKYARVEAGTGTDGLDLSACNHNADESHNVLIVFDQLFGGGQGVSGLKTYDGVTVVYPNN